MDKISKLQDSISWNLEVLKEPRGLIKVLQFILAIFAFATTTSVHTSSAFTINCNGTVKEQELKFGYPFKLNSFSFNVPLCEGSTSPSATIHLYGNYSSASQFYVFIGVMAFIYSLAAFILYVCFDDKYRKYDKIPIVDFIVTIVFTLMWLISSSAWADGVSQVKRYTNPEELWMSNDMDTVRECGGYPSSVCDVTKNGQFASLNVSIIFGFLNMFVWGGNVWFLYKETSWFKVRTEHPEQRTDLPGAAAEEPPRFATVDLN